MKINPYSAALHAAVITIISLFAIPAASAAAAWEPEYLELHINARMFLVGETLSFSAFCSDSRGGLSTRSDIAYVELIGENGKPLTQIKIKLTNGRGDGYFFFGTNVSSGNYSIIAYTKWMRNFDHHNFFHTTLAVINPRQPIVRDLPQQSIPEPKFTFPEKTDNLTVSINKGIYGRREKVSLTLRGNYTSPAFVSINVSIKDSTGNNLPIDDDKSRATAVSPEKISILPDVRGELISGVITYKEDGMPFSKRSVTLSAPAHDFGFVTSLTDSSGRFFFNTVDLASDFILIKPYDLPMDKFNVRPDTPFLSDYSLFIPPKLVMTKALLKKLEQRHLSTLVENAFYTAKKDSLIISQSPAKFFPTADRIYRLDDFTRFPTMEDVFREIIQEVVTKGKTGNFSLSLRNIVTGEKFGSEPLILLDGVPVSDANTVMAYDPMLVKSIAVVTHHYYYGAVEADGILSLETFKGKAEAIATNDFFRLDYIPVQAKKQLFAPDYEKDERSRIPDFRTQLFWKPEVTVTSQGEESLFFFTGDLEGEYVIEVVGRTSSGEKIYCTEIFSVK